MHFSHVSLATYSYATAQNHTTINRFYMMTQTILSAASQPSPQARRVALRARRSAPSHKDLEARLNVVSVTQAPLPVRSCHAPQKEPPHTAASLKPQILIANLELEFHLTHTKLSPLRIPNRKYSPLLRLQFSSPSRPMSANESSDTRHSSVCVLIHRSAIKSQRKPFENNNLEISNRR
jgi:hypothetical protein